MGPTPTPGKLRLWTYQAVANGADTVVYFRWRACPFGTEENWHGILNHDGKPNRRYEEISRVGSEMEQLSKNYGALKPIARVAIIKSFDSEWSHSIHKHVEGFNYDQLLLSYYKPFFDKGITVDFVEANEDLQNYSLVLAPALLMLKENEKTNLENYVKKGGKLHLTFRSGIKDEYNNMLTDTVPGVFRELAGIEIYDYDPQFEKQNKVSTVFGEGTTQLWCDIVTPTTAKSLGIYTNDFYAGQTCFTVNKYGEGEVFYLGCDLDETAMDNLGKYLCKKANIPANLYNIPGVETVEATDGEKGAFFIMNHNSFPVVINLDNNYTEMITKNRIVETVLIEGYGVAILKE
jgi:beta-galactosidase